MRLDRTLSLYNCGYIRIVSLIEISRLSVYKLTAKVMVSAIYSQGVAVWIAIAPFFEMILPSGIHPLSANLTAGAVLQGHLVCHKSLLEVQGLHPLELPHLSPFISALLAALHSSIPRSWWHRS